jgi:hypothetical protein
MRDACVVQRRRNGRVGLGLSAADVEARAVRFHGVLDLHHVKIQECQYCIT